MQRERLFFKVAKNLQRVNPCGQKRIHIFLRNDCGVAFTLLKNPNHRFEQKVWLKFDENNL